MEYESLREEGRKIRVKLSQLYSCQTDLEKEYYCEALRLPNRTHPDVVAFHSSCSLKHFLFDDFTYSHLKMNRSTPAGFGGYLIVYCTVVGCDYQCPNVSTSMPAVSRPAVTRTSTNPTVNCFMNFYVEIF